jgi:hypothetical protein
MWFKQKSSWQKGHSFASSSSISVSQMEHFKPMFFSIRPLELPPIFASCSMAPSRIVLGVLAYFAELALSPSVFIFLSCFHEKRKNIAPDLSGLSSKRRSKNELFYFSKYNHRYTFKMNLKPDHRFVYNKRSSLSMETATESAGTQQR